MEMRRHIAGRLLQEGKGIREVARIVEAAPSSVVRWKQELEQGGLEALTAKPPSGRQARLTSSQKTTLAVMLSKGARAAGFANELWTLSQVAQVIEREFGVSYHPGHVWYILREIGFSPQKPEQRARERDEATIARWRREDWERIKKKPTVKS